MDEYLELVNKLRIAAKLPVYSKGAQKYFTEAADAIEELIRRQEGANEVLNRAIVRLRDLNQHMRDAVEANEEIRSV